MKKKILSLALIAMSLTSFGSFAQSPASSCNAPQGQCVAGQDCGQKIKRAHKNPYEGLNLTDAQKAQLQQLDAKRKAEKQKKMEALKAEKQRNDSVRNAAAQADRLQYLEEVKEIVGPDQYIDFLENYYVGAPQKGKAMKMSHKDGKDSKGHKPGKHQKDGKQGPDKKK